MQQQQKKNTGAGEQDVAFVIHLLCQLDHYQSNFRHHKGA